MNMNLFYNLISSCCAACLEEPPTPTWILVGRGLIYAFAIVSVIFAIYIAYTEPDRQADAKKAAIADCINYQRNPKSLTWYTYNNKYYGMVSNMVCEYVDVRGKWNGMEVKCHYTSYDDHHMIIEAYGLYRAKGEDGLNWHFITPNYYKFIGRDVDVLHSRQKEEYYNQRFRSIPDLWVRNQPVPNLIVPNEFLYCMENKKMFTPENKEEFDKYMEEHGYV